MVTGKDRCPICKKVYSPKQSQSKLKVPTGEMTRVTHQPIYSHVCMNCFRSRKDASDYGFTIRKNGLIWYFDDEGNFERTKFA